MKDIPKEKKSQNLRTGIIITLATILTSVSLAMITVSAWERSATLLEAILVALLSGSVALSAHLLPALVKRRVGKFSGSMVTIIWIVAVAITLYSHTVFFVTNMTQSGDKRAESSEQVNDMSYMAKQTENMADGSNTRSKVDITRDIANNEIQLQNYLSRRCKNVNSTSRCKSVESGIIALQSKDKALNVELDEANRVYGLKEKALQMQQKALDIKNDKRLDPVTEKISSIFNGVNVDAITLSISVINAALLEMLASLFWWLVWPNKKIENEKVIDIKLESKMNNKSQKISEINNQENEENNSEIETLYLSKNIDKESLPLIKSGKIVYKQGYFDKTQEDIFISQYIKNISLFKSPIIIPNIERYKGNSFSEDIALMNYVKRIDIITIIKKSKNLEEVFNKIENKKEESINDNKENVSFNPEFVGNIFENNDSNDSITLFDLEPENKEIKENEVFTNKDNDFSNMNKESEDLMIHNFIKNVSYEDKKDKVSNSKFSYLRDNSLLVNKKIDEKEESPVKSVVVAVPTNTDKLPMENSISKINNTFNRKVVEEKPVLEKIEYDNIEEKSINKNKKENGIELRKWGKFNEEKKDIEEDKKETIENILDKDTADIWNLFNS